MRRPFSRMLGLEVVVSGVVVASLIVPLMIEGDEASGKRRPAIAALQLLCKALTTRTQKRSSHPPTNRPGNHQQQDAKHVSHQK